MIAARVMVVEDERVVALHLKQQLTRLGYSVPAMATSGEKALRQIHELRPDVVLMDIHIDGQMDGIATAAAIPGDLQIPVVYLTAYSEEPTLDRARDTKPYGYLLKPFSERELHATLQMVLERRRSDIAIRENEQRLETLIAERTAELREETIKRLQAEYERHETQKMEIIGQLTGGVAHDFNNFLSVIMGSLDKIQRRPDLTPAEIQRTVSTALKSAGRASTLTNRLLAFSRRQPLDPKPVSLNHLVGSMTDLLQRTLGEGVALQTTLASDLWWTFVDTNQMESALLNLAVNARDAMSDGGKLMIETSNVVLDDRYCATNGDVKPGEYAVVAVTDNGAGMSKDLVAKAFEPFFTTKRNGQGTGLGLSQVYGFLKQSGGHAKIYSEAGEGTTVKLYLPKMQGESFVAGDSGSEAAPVLRSTYGETILVVEDDDDVRENTSTNLRELGYAVVEAADGQAALTQLQANPGIHLLFTDVGLPGLNGRQVADEARRMCPGLRIIFTSGYAHHALVHQGRLDAGVDLLAKPFTFQDLASKIRRALDGPGRA